MWCVDMTAQVITFRDDFQKQFINILMEGQLPSLNLISQFHIRLHKDVSEASNAVFLTSCMPAISKAFVYLDLNLQVLRFEEFRKVYLQLQREKVIVYCGGRRAVQQLDVGLGLPCLVL